MNDALAEGPKRSLGTVVQAVIVLFGELEDLFPDGS